MMDLVWKGLLYLMRIATIELVLCLLIIKEIKNIVNNDNRSRVTLFLIYIYLI